MKQCNTDFVVEKHFISSSFSPHSPSLSSSLIRLPTVLPSSPVAMSGQSSLVIGGALHGNAVEELEYRVPLPPVAVTIAASATTSGGATVGMLSSHLHENELYRFRTKLCGRKSRYGECGLEDSCPFSHCLSWSRRNPMKHAYRPQLCPNVKFEQVDGKMKVTSSCPRGRKCMFAHTKEEQMYHPQVYKTQLCNFFQQKGCDKYFCPFAHGIAEIKNRDDVMFRVLQGPEVLLETSSQRSEKNLNKLVTKGNSWSTKANGKSEVEADVEALNVTANGELFEDDADHTKLKDINHYGIPSGRGNNGRFLTTTTVTTYCDEGISIGEPKRDACMTSEDGGCEEGQVVCMPLTSSLLLEYEGTTPYSTPGTFLNVSSLTKGAESVDIADYHCQGQRSSAFSVLPYSEENFVSGRHFGRQLQGMLKGENVLGNNFYHYCQLSSKQDEQCWSTPNFPLACIGNSLDSDTYPQNFFSASSNIATVGGNKKAERIYGRLVEDSANEGMGNDSECKNNMKSFLSTCCQESRNATDPHQLSNLKCMGNPEFVGKVLSCVMQSYTGSTLSSCVSSMIPMSSMETALSSPLVQSPEVICKPKVAMQQYIEKKNRTAFTNPTLCCTQSDSQSSQADLSAAAAAAATAFLAFVTPESLDSKAIIALHHLLSLASSAHCSTDCMTCSPLTSQILHTQSNLPDCISTTSSSTGNNRFNCLGQSYSLGEELSKPLKGTPTGFTTSAQLPSLMERHDAYSMKHHGSTQTPFSSLPMRKKFVIVLLMIVLVIHLQKDLTDAKITRSRMMNKFCRRSVMCYVILLNWETKLSKVLIVIAVMA